MLFSPQLIAQTKPAVIVAAGGGSPTFTKTGNPAGQGGLGFSTNNVTFSSVSIGTASSDRIVIVAVAGIHTGSVSGVTCDSGGGNVAMTKAVDVASASNRATSIWYLSVTSGTSATFIVTTSGAYTSCNIEVGMATGINATPTDTQGTSASAPADDFTLTAITIPAGGFAIASAGFEFAGVSARVYKNNYSLQYSSTAGTDSIGEMAESITAGSSAASVQRGSFQLTSMCVAAWGA